MQVNYLGAVRGMQAFLPQLRAAGGVLVVNSALMTRTVLPFNGGYAPSKAALEAWAVALRRELAPQGVDVVIIRAAAIHSALEAKQDADSVPSNAAYPLMRDFIRGGMVQMARVRDNAGADPERVAERVEAALDRTCRRRYRLAGVGAVPIRLLGLLPPALQDAAMHQLITRVAAMGRHQDAGDGSR
ncbi:MAG: SDR family NAD(P)-dependent oxidoreductase [Candidatus Nanopelagicales bacterium]